MTLVQKELKEAYIWEKPPITETFVISTINSYTNIYKSWHTIVKVTAEWSVTFASTTQMYLRLNDTQSETSMYGYVFDYVNSSKQWQLQLKSWNSWLNKHTSSNGAVLQSDTFKIEFTLDSASITFNNTTTAITYDSAESSRIATLFASWTPYFYTWQYWTLTSRANTVTVEYAEA